jgi:hypothetical protein
MGLLGYLLLEELQMGQDRCLQSLRWLLLLLRWLLLLLHQNRLLLRWQLHSVRFVWLQTHSFRFDSAYYQGMDRSFGRT